MLKMDQIVADNLESESKENLLPSKTTSNTSTQDRPILSSIHRSFTANAPSVYSYYFYTNTNTVLNKLVMSYEEQLQKAIHKNNYELCEELIVKRHCDVNKPHDHKYPLCLAAENNCYEIAKLLIQNGANANQLDYYDQSCLIHAVGNADLNLIQLLVASGADVNRSDSNGVNPLHVALMRMNDEICDFLIESGADINLADKQKTTPLSVAVKNEYIYMIDKLLDMGADPDGADENGDTPLIKAIWMSMSSKVEHEQVLRLVKRLVDLGADVNVKNENGRTPLFTAIYQNNTELALYLIDRGARCDDIVTNKNLTLLHYACFQGSFDLCKRLLEEKCNPNSVASSCETPVYIAVTRGYLDILGLLVDHGADVNLSIGSDCDYKLTAIQASIYYLSEYDVFKRVVDKLIEGKVNLNVCNPDPIVYICLQYNKINFAKYLISVGASIEQPNVFKQSFFCKAFLNKNLELMEMCIMAGFSLYEETWIQKYLDNPAFIEYTDYYVRQSVTTAPPIDENNNEIEPLNEEEEEEANGDASSYDINDLAARSDQELNDMLNLDEYFFERFHASQRKRRDMALEKRKKAEMASKIYALVKNYYSNPLSLKELARINIRKHMLSVDHQMKVKIEKGPIATCLPRCLKDYLLMKEFNL